MEQIDEVPFKRVILDGWENAFSRLTKELELEETGKGRLGGILVALDADRVPLIRTTTKYEKSMGLFGETHLELMKSISEAFATDHKFNNAMVEIYDGTYRKMGYHCDQTLDLADDSFICVFSCYENASKAPGDTRKLVVQKKGEKEHETVLMENNSCILFSSETNSKFLHKIILDSQQKWGGNRWLGITMRLSKTLIEHRDGKFFFGSNGKELTVADAKQRKEFFAHKSKENSTIGKYDYEIDFTLSESDLIFPKK
jgi:hypothetical protein